MKKQYCYFLGRDILVPEENKDCHCINDNCHLGESDKNGFITCPTCGYGSLNLSRSVRAITSNDKCQKCISNTR